MKRAAALLALSLIATSLLAQVVVITYFTVADVPLTPNPGNPPTGKIRLYGDSTSGNLTCLTSSGASCIGGGGGSGTVSGLTTGQVGIAGSATSITSSKALQGTDASVLSSGTVSGVAAALCTDANGGATTTGCPSAPTAGGYLQFGTGIVANSPATITNATIMVPIALTSQIATGHVVFNVGIADNSANKYDLGLYSNCGPGLTASLAANIGAQTLTTTGFKRLAWSQGTVTLNPGAYCFALTGQSTGVAIQLAGGDGAGTMSTFTWISGAVGQGWDNPSVTTSGGALAASFTVPSEADGVVTLPMFILEP